LAEYQYSIILTPEDEGGFSVDVPALSGCHTCGETREEALAMAREAIQLYIDSLLDKKMSIPPSDKFMPIVETVKIVA
jgi:predicted RNase H-like HicB family nuclease